MQDLLSKLVELISEFSIESNYKNIIKYIKKENANNIRTQLQRLWKETYY
jgi:hypothetical protein